MSDELDDIIEQHMMAGAGYEEYSPAEGRRLEAELARLRAENERLREALGIARAGLEQFPNPRGLTRRDWDNGAIRDVFRLAFKNAAIACSHIDALLGESEGADDAGN